MLSNAGEDLRENKFRQKIPRAWQHDYFRKLI
jgi:hypothetical protein